MIGKDHYLFLMMGIYEDFDDDLLFDAMELLTISSDFYFTPLILKVTNIIN
jgi:hypothetical protein